MIRLLFISSLILFGCVNHENRSARSKKSAEGPVADSSSIFSYSVSTWLDSNLHTKYKRTIELEEQWEDDSIPSARYDPPRDFEKKFGSFLRWSADNSKFIDIESHRHIVSAVEDQSQIKTGSKPKTEVALVDVKSKKRMKLLEVGAETTILDARWQNLKEALVLGTYRGKESIDTLLWLFNNEDNLYRLYKLKTDIK